MTKDGIREKVTRDLKALYDAPAREPIPADMQELMNKLR